MKNLSLAALLAAGIFAIYTAPSFALSIMGTPTPPCKVNCGGPGQPGNDPTEPGEPFNPFDFPDGGEGGEGGDDPKDEDDPKDDGTPGDDPKDGDDPKEDGNPGDDPKDDPKDEPGNDPDYPGLTKQEVAEMRACIARLDGLPQVSETQINQFGQPYKVTLKPICETQGGLTEVGNAFVENGNVYGLEGALKRNELINIKLGQSSYKARDVVGIDFDATGNATLLVHKRRS